MKGLVLSLFGGGKSFIQKITSCWSMEYGFNSMNIVIILFAMLIYLSEDVGRLEAINRSFCLIYSKYLTFLFIILSGPWSKADNFLKKIV